MNHKFHLTLKSSNRKTGPGWRPEIDKSLVVSTAHFDRKAHGRGTLGIVRPFEYGWTVFAPTIRAKSMQAVRQCALANGCDWIRFDCDANQAPHLPTFPEK